jgi:sigma-B regulation protein RsbU (phosphoserine phosphatase)
MTIGNNRYLKVLIYYYFPRAAIVSLFFMVSNLLNKRTYKLLDEEIKIHDKQEKVRTELNVAKEIQMNTLPEGIVDTKDVEIVGELKAANEVGGDLYDYINIDEDHVAVIIGDVSGKGVPAAMFMMKTITSFRDFARAGKTPSQILKEINSSIFQGNKTSMFVTCFLVILDKKTGRLQYSNAGHNPPIIGANKDFRYLKCKSGFLLGCFKDSPVVDEEIILKPGESITLYTDGVTEARNREGGFFGEARFLKAINKKKYNCIVELHHAIKDEIANFVGDAPQSDDITFLTIKYRGNNYSYLEKNFNAKKENIAGMLEYLSNFEAKYDFPKEFRNKLVIVGDEIFSNIVNHGYNNEGGEIFVRLLYDIDDKEFSLTIIDKAEAFNPLEFEGQLVGSDAKKQQVGGLGIMIVKKIMTECAYDRINGKNILVLKKKFD